MINIKNILCPIDYSIYSEIALKYAIEFAEKYGAKLYLMHVLDIRVYDINDPELYNVNIVDKETLDKLKAEFDVAVKSGDEAGAETAFKGMDNAVGAFGKAFLGNSLFLGVILNIISYMFMRLRISKGIY